MDRLLIVSLAEGLSEYERIACDYGVGYEINDFYNPELLEDEERVSVRIEEYKTRGIPRNSTMHGAFYDTILFSFELEMRELAKKRMRQSMEIARKLKLNGVVFHTNYMPALEGEMYDKRVVEYTVSYLKELLMDFPEVNIYLENMFDDSPNILVLIAKELKDFNNFGICLDYAHANVFAKDYLEFVKELAPYVKHLHINDNNLEKDQHLAVGDGKIDWEVFADFYRDYFSECTVLIETTKPENQIKSLEFLKHLNL